MQTANAELDCHARSPVQRVNVCGGSMRKNGARGPNSGDGYLGSRLVELAPLSARRPGCPRFVDGEFVRAKSSESSLGRFSRAQALSRCLRATESGDRRALVGFQCGLYANARMLAGISTARRADAFGVSARDFGPECFVARCRSGRRRKLKRFPLLRGSIVHEVCSCFRLLAETGRWRFDRAN